MGVGITCEQRELVEAGRGWAARTVPPQDVRKLLDAGVETDAGQQAGRSSYWGGLAGMGLLGVHLPEEYDGGCRGRADARPAARG